MIDGDEADQEDSETHEVVPKDPPPTIHGIGLDSDTCEVNHNTNQRYCLTYGKGSHLPITIRAVTEDKLAPMLSRVWA